MSASSETYLCAISSFDYRVAMANTTLSNYASADASASSEFMDENECQTRRAPSGSIHTNTILVETLFHAASMCGCRVPGPSWPLASLFAFQFWADHTLRDFATLVWSATTPRNYYYYDYSITACLWIYIYAQRACIMILCENFGVDERMKAISSTHYSHATMQENMHTRR